MDGNVFTAEFIKDLKLHRVPSTVLKQLKIALLDIVGASLAGAKVKGAKILLNFSLGQMGKSSEATIIGANRKLSCVSASLINGFITNALDIDDGYRKIKGHPGAATFPAVLAVAESVKATGREFLEAFLIGYEVGIRAGEILHSHYGYYHGSGSWGAIASAAAVSKLLKLSKSQIIHALGIAEAFAPLVPEMRAVTYPSMAPKDGIPWGCMVGTSAAFLAKRGFTSIPSLLGDSKRNKEVFSLGRDYKILNLYFKPYPCCRWAQPALDGLLKILSEKKLSWNEIHRIKIRTFSEAASLYRGIPKTIEEAEYHLLYPVAVTAIYGEFTPKYLSGKFFKENRIVKLMKKIEVIVDPKIQREFPNKCLTSVKIITRKGDELSSGVIGAKGDYNSPMSETELEDKFKRITKEILGERKMEALIKLIKNFEDHSVVDLVNFLK
jgi:2-methylcitrate dehydratase PrpD